MPFYITVVTRNPEQVPAYLYGGVEIAETYEEKAFNSSVLILQTESPYTAEDQRDRLNSGLHAAQAHLSLDLAKAFLAETFGVKA